MTLEANTMAVSPTAGQGPFPVYVQLSKRNEA